jgi:hypothetical protein
VARMGEGRGAYRVLVGRPEGKRPLGRPRRRWEDNIKMDFREMGLDGANWIRLVQDWVQSCSHLETQSLHCDQGFDSLGSIFCDVIRYCRLSTYPPSDKHWYSLYFTFKFN